MSELARQESSLTPQEAAERLVFTHWPWAEAQHREDGFVGLDGACSDGLVADIAETLKAAHQEGARQMRERCAVLIDAFPRPSEEEIEYTMLEHQPCLLGERHTLERLAASVRALNLEPSSGG